MRPQQYPGNKLAKRKISWFAVIVIVLILFYRIVLEEMKYTKEMNGATSLHKIIGSDADKQVNIHQDEEAITDRKFEVHGPQLPTSLEEMEKKVHAIFQKDYGIREDDKMKAILHIGPHKTGTTSIQHILIQNFDILSLDGYSMPQTDEIFGKFPYSTHNVALGLRGLEYFVNQKYLKQFQSFLINSQQGKKNIVLSSEEFSKTKPEIFHTILSPLYDTRIVIAYRRFFELLVSRHNEIQKKEETIENFVPWVTKFFEGLKSVSPIALMESYQEYFDDVVIINFHDRKQTLEASFFCDAVQDMTNMCQNVKHIKLDRANLSVPLQIKEIILAAKKSKILDEEIQNIKAEVLIHKFMSESRIGVHDLPLHCISDEILEDIFQWTLKEEMQLVPIWFESMGGEARLRNDFQSFKRHSACQVKVSELLEDERWVRLFRSMH